MGFNSNNLFDYYPAQTGTIGLLSIPHAGEMIPEIFLPYLTDNHEAIFQDVDYAVDCLVDIPALQSVGIAVMVARIHRVCVDLNRAPELAVLNWKENTFGIPLVVREPDEKTVKVMYEQYYLPYYTVLDRIITEISAKGVAPVIDLHSMPSAPTAFHLRNNPQQKSDRPDFCVSDLKGISCAPEFIKAIVEKLSYCGFRPSINDPYFGGYLTKYINTLKTNNVQIETKRSLYMDEKKRELLDEKAQQVKSALTQTIREIMIAFAPTSSF